MGLKYRKHKCQPLIQEMQGRKVVNHFDANLRRAPNQDKEMLSVVLNFLVLKLMCVHFRRIWKL